MATYRITDPTTGRKLKLTGDSPPTEQELNEIFSNLGPARENPSLIKRGYDALAVPERMSREGLGQLAQMVPSAEPTGNMARDLALNTPKVLAESVAEVAPSFISRGAMITGGALKGAGMVGRALKPILKAGASQVESLSGAVPGALTAAYKDSSLIGAPGKKAVQQLYQEGKESLGGGFRQTLKEIPDKKQFVDEAFKLAKKGELSPAEALEARKSLDSVKKSVAGPYFEEVRGKLDKIAKVAFEKGDAAYQRAVKAESLRNLIPQNKYGGASAFKTGIITLLEGLAEAGGLPKVVARTAQAAMSPLAAGTVATAAGMGSRAIAPLINNATKVAPLAAAAFKVLTEDVAKKFLRKAKGDKDKARTMALEAGYEIPE